MPLLYCRLQFCRRVAYLRVPVKPRPGFRREQPAPMHIFEIAVRKLVSSLRIHGVTFVHPEMPLRVFCIAVQANEIVFRSGRRFMFVPPALAISDQMPMPDKLGRELDGVFVQLETAIRLRASITDCAETNN